MSLACVPSTSSNIPSGAVNILQSNKPTLFGTRIAGRRLSDNLNKGVVEDGGVRFDGVFDGVMSVLLATVVVSPLTGVVTSFSYFGDIHKNNLWA